jgi:hypothetical protein
MGALLISIAVIIFTISINWANLGDIFFAICASSVILILYLLWSISRRDRSFSVLSSFATLFCAFHFGILAADMAGIPVHTMLNGVLWWYLQEELVLGSYAAALMFLLGLAMASGLALWRAAPPRPSLQASNLRAAPVTILLGLAVTLWLIIVVGFLGITNYTQYNALARDGAGLHQAALMVLYPAISALFFWSSLTSRRLIWPFMIYAVFGLIAFPVGLRGEVLFPLAMVVPTLAAQNRLKLSMPTVVFGAYAVLLISSFGRIFRADSNLSEALSGASGLTGLAELGGSLRPVVEVQRWLTGGLDDLRWGETYYAPFERTLLKFFPFTDRTSALQDDRLMNVVLVSRTSGNYGFSIAAESLINFGMLGCVAAGLTAGGVLIAFGRRARLGTAPIIWSAVVFGLFIHIRQAFVTAYGSAMMFLVVSLVIFLLFPKYRPSSSITTPRNRHALP